ncbi:ABC-three component system protein [Sphingomonas sanguinis]|uniref:ABC-three component systems C-terminal domain-containing protein n=1 Tax=Sphingomonas sanguinis TaxID=33051 RepID=A0A147HXD8_9SPHN|nr:ABC-three component system protein [Sphingomonas sanguinis]KTT69573.1 hypothetical protein NS319_09885 [Sphingomonas sanguinis]
MAGDNKFDATASMVGYLYQCRFALFKAIEATRDAPGADISIERFDDVAFEQNGDPVELIQTKHHLAGRGSLSDASTDLWKTLRVWAERIAADPATVLSSRFFLITTATAPSGSAASLLRGAGRDETEALALLEASAAASKSVTNAPAYQAFVALSSTLRFGLLKAMTVLDAAPDALDLQADIEAELHHAAKTQHVPALVERLEGWWFRQVIASLSVTGAPPIPVIAVDAKIEELRESFQRDALPVDFAELDVTKEILDEHDERLFVRQLRDIQVAPKRIEWAIRDYYRAFEQRSRWTRDDLLVDNELQRYERGLIEAWEPRFESACEECDGRDDAGRISAGKQIYQWAERDADFPLRSVRQRFLTHGSFHILANRLALGWHPDFRAKGGGDE